MAHVPLVDLEVILRYSLAIRQETADARDVLEALDQSRSYVLRLLRDEHGGDVEETEAIEAADDGAGDESNGEVVPTQQPMPQPLPRMGRHPALSRAPGSSPPARTDRQR